MISLSVVIATYNEEKNIERCLYSLKGFADEVIIIDGGSCDNTIEIAKKYNAHIFIKDNPPIFHINKQYGLNKAKNKWILQLDADEVVSDSLKQEIISILKQDQEKVFGYYIPRRNYFLGKWMRKGGLYPDAVIRLVRKGKAYFPCQSVHEQIIVGGEVGRLNSDLLHYSYPTLKEYLIKANRYTSLTASEFKNKGIKKNLVNFVNFILFKPSATFFSIFIRHQGYQDGIYGFIWAIFSGMHYFIAYAKYLKVNSR